MAATESDNSISIRELKSDNVSFLVIGDWGKTEDKCTEGTPQQQVAKKLKEQYSACDFVISVGDNFYFDDNKNEKYKNLSIRNKNKNINNTTSKNNFTKIYLEYWYKIWYNCYINGEDNVIPWYGVLGNKEYQYHCNLTPHFPLKLQRNKEATFYTTLNHANKWKIVKIGSLTCPLKKEGDDKLLFIFIDTTPLIHMQKNKNKGKCTPALEKNKKMIELDSIKVKINNIISSNRHKYCILVGHHPAYSKGHFKKGTQKAGNNKLIINLIEDINKDNSKINMYLCGHQHYLDVFKKDNVVYVISGAGGEDSNKISRDINDKPRYGFFKITMKKEGDNYKPVLKQFKQCLFKLEYIWRNENGANQVLINNFPNNFLNNSSPN